MQTERAITEAPYLPLRSLERDIQLTPGADGVLYLRSRVALDPVDRHLPQILARTAAAFPDRPWLAQRRGPDKAWSVLDYAGGKRQVDAVTAALLELRMPGRPVMVLSANSLEHGVLQLAAMQARMPHAPVTPAYSLLAEDLAKLQAMADLLQPGLVFAQSGVQFERALRGLRLPADTVLACAADPLPDLPMRMWADLLAAPSTAAMAAAQEAAVAASVAAIEPSTVAKYLFTSGSTGVPKAVTITQGMLATAVTMHRQMFALPGPEQQVVLGWMPWSHVAAGLVQFATTIDSAAVYYLDEGKPVASAFGETLRNLRDVSPSNFSSVPVGFTMLVDELERDETLARRFFSKLQRLGYSGAKLPASVLERIQGLAVRHTGFRVPFASAYGSTETGASVTMIHWAGDGGGGIGLPHPGVELKLIPLDDERYEIRVKSDAVTPGYLNNPERTAEAFDEEGFFRMGDAVRFADRSNVHEGLVFGGRVAEEFKLQTGIFVRVGALRVEAIEAAQGLLADVVVAGSDQPYVSLLAWPNLAACRSLQNDPGLDLRDIVEAPWLKERLRDAFRDHNRRHTASSMRIRRLVLLSEPPSLGAGELTDKGYINQRAVLERRAELVESLYASQPPHNVILID